MPAKKNIFVIDSKSTILLWKKFKGIVKYTSAQKTAYLGLNILFPIKKIKKAEMRSAITITNLPSKRPLKNDAKINWKIPRIHGTTGKTKYLRDKKRPSLSFIAISPSLR